MLFILIDVCVIYSHDIILKRLSLGKRKWKKREWNYSFFFSLYIPRGLTIADTSVSVYFLILLSIPSPSLFSSIYPPWTHYSRHLSSLFIFYIFLSISFFRFLFYCVSIPPPCSYSPTVSFSFHLSIQISIDITTAVNNKMITMMSDNNLCFSVLLWSLSLSPRLFLSTLSLGLSASRP